MKFTSDPKSKEGKKTYYKTYQKYLQRGILVM